MLFVLKDFFLATLLPSTLATATKHVLETCHQLSETEQHPMNRDFYSPPVLTTRSIRITLLIKLLVYLQALLSSSKYSVQSEHAKDLNHRKPFWLVDTYYVRGLFTRGVQKVLSLAKKEICYNSETLSHQVKTQYLQIVDTSIKHPISGQSTTFTVVEGCIFVIVDTSSVIEDYWSSSIFSGIFQGKWK